MSRHRVLWVAMAVLAGTGACGEDETPPPPPPDELHSQFHGSAFTIPDPGTAMTGGAWDGRGVSNATPDTALPVGIITDPTNPYLTDDESAFFVFRAGPMLTQITLAAGQAAELLHLHSGAGTMFGPQVQPTMSRDDGQWIVHTWPVTPGEVYVAEVGLPGSAFF